MYHGWLIFILAVYLAGAPQGFAGQSVKEDTEKERAKRAAESFAAQIGEEPATRIEKFLARKDVLLIKEGYPIGSLPAQQGLEVQLEVLVVSAAGEAGKVYGLRVTRLANRQGSQALTGLIDFDEVTALQNALDTIVKAAVANSEKNAEAKPSAANDQGAALGPATEFSLTSRSGWQTGMLQTGRQQTGFIQFNVAAPDATVFFGIGALGRLRNLLAEARSKLLALGAR